MGRIGAHAAGVEAAVAVQGALVVLRGGEEFGGLAVAQGVEGDFHAFEQFLDDDARPGRAKGLADEDVLDGLVGLGHVAADEDAFAQGEAVGFDGAAPAQGGGEARGGGRIGEGAGARGGDAIFLHELLGEDLGGLEPGGLLVRAPDAQAILLEQIHDAQGEGVVGADDGEVGALFLGEGEQAGEVFGAEGDAFDGRAVLARRSWAMPALPGAHQSRVTCGDWASFHTRACSRPPEPMTRSCIGRIESGIATRRERILLISCWTFGGIRVNETPLN